jgi:hypothetical protein
VFPPFVSHVLPLEAAVADPLAKLAYLESISLFHVLFPAHTSKAESWARNVFWPRRPWSDDHGPRVPSSGAGCQSGSATSQARQIGAGDKYECLRERLSHMLPDSADGFRHTGEAQGTPCESVWFVRLVKSEQQPDVCRLTRHYCSGASTNIALRQ